MLCGGAIVHRTSCCLSRSHNTYSHKDAPGLPDNLDHRPVLAGICVTGQQSEGKKSHGEDARAVTPVHILIMCDVSQRQSAARHSLRQENVNRCACM